MAIEAQKYSIFSGDLYFDEFDDDNVPQGGIKLGNFTLKLKQNSDKKELISVENSTAGDAIDTRYLKKPPEATLEGEGLTSYLFGIMFGTSVVDTSVTGATVTSEAHTVRNPDRHLKVAYNDISTVAIAKSTNADTAYTTVVADNTIEDVAHGLVNGDVVFLTSLANTTGVSINTPYYVVNKTNDDFQLALTSGGAAIDLTGTDGSGNYRKALNPNSYALENARLGLIAPLSTGSTPVAANDILHVYYTYATKTYKRIASGSKASKSGALYGDLQDNTTGLLARVRLPKITLISNSEIQLVGEEYVKVSLTGTPNVFNGEAAIIIDYDVE